MCTGDVMCVSSHCPAPQRWVLCVSLTTRRQGLVEGYVTTWSAREGAPSPASLPNLPSNLPNLCLSQASPKPFLMGPLGVRRGSGLPQDDPATTLSPQP